MNGTPRTHVLLVALACLAPATMTASASAQNPGGVAFPTAPQLATPTNAMLGDPVTFSGTVPGAAGATIVVQRQDRTGAWIQTATALADATGFFQAQWHSDHAGQFAVRALAAGEATATALASVSTTSPVSTLAAPLMTIYRSAIATWYGPGFFDHRTACGHILKKTTLGVANKTLPCGTQVALDFRGRTLTVPVVDRGPYANNAHWDLTQATARALAMKATETIGAVSLPGTAPAAKNGASAKQPASAAAAR